jgi:hypothetical protein
MWTFSILGIAAVVFTVISLRYYNLLFSFVAMISWVGLWAYNLNYPLTNITQGSFVHEVMTYSFIIMAVVVMLLYFRNRGQAQGMFNANTEKEGAKNTNNSTPSRGLMELDTNEYRKLMRERIRNRRRNK